jgi:hypothetical protein
MLATRGQTACCRTQARLAEDLPDRRCRHVQAEPIELASDPLVTPARILAGEAKHEPAELAAYRRSACSAGVGPAAGDQASVPAKQRRGGHQERAPARAGQQPARCRKQDPIARVQLRPTYLPTQHRQLMTQNHDLQLFESLRTRPKEHELQRAAQRQIAKRPEQEQLLNNQRGRDADPTRETDAPAPRIELMHPTGGLPARNASVFLRSALMCVSARSSLR